MSQKELLDRTVFEIKDIQSQVFEVTLYTYTCIIYMYIHSYVISIYISIPISSSIYTYVYIYPFKAWDLSSP